MAFINALVHNDYNISQPLISFFNNRIEILSHGGLPKGQTKVQFFNGISRPRNDMLARIFQDMDLVEHTGHGIPTIVIMVLSLLYIFKQKTFYSPFINELGSLCLLNNMIHENYYFKKYGADWLTGKLDNITYIGRHGYLLIFTLCYFVASFILAFLYKKAKSFIIKNSKR